MSAQRDLTRDDIMDPAEFAKVRTERRRALLPIKKLRRIALGPHATFYFENFDTMWYQIHEMLHIEQGGEEQITDELTAYAPLVPKGNELVATLMFEINDEIARRRILAELGWVEDKVYVKVGDEKAYSRPEQDVERTTPDGKTSSVHFLHFDLSEEAAAKFTDPSVDVMIGCDHENYGHLALLNMDVRQELARDL